MKNFYQGENAIRSYLDPNGKDPFPLVELDRELNPFYDDGVHMYVKMMCVNPLLNIKMLPTWTMLKNADLAGVSSAVEYSSGNTVLSLSVLAQYFGIEDVKAIVTSDVPEHKKNMLRLVGADLIISDGDPTPKVSPPTGGIAEAIEMGKKEGFINLHQYINESVLEASEKYIGREIYDALGDSLKIFTASIGTSGTIFGASRYLKSKNKDVLVLGSAIEVGESIPGPRGRNALPYLGFDWNTTVDEVDYVRRKEAYEYSLKLIKKGLFLGPSSGMQYFSMTRYLQGLKDSGQLSGKLGPDSHVVFLGCDTMFPYVDDYFATLGLKTGL